MYKKTLGLLFLFLLAPPSICSLPIVGDFEDMSKDMDSIKESVSSMEEDFDNMNKTMQHIFFQLMYFVTSTDEKYAHKMDILNGHLSRLTNATSSYSKSVGEVKQSVQEFEALKDIVMFFMSLIMGLAVLSILIFVLSVYSILKKIDDGG